MTKRNANANNRKPPTMKSNRMNWMDSDLQALYRKNLKQAKNASLFSFQKE